MKTTPWRQVRRGGDDPSRQARVESVKSAMRQASVLAELRAHRGVTQIELSDRLGTAQSGVSRIERRDDLFLSTLVDYVEALGGHLEIAAIFDNERIPLVIGESRQSESQTTVPA